MTSSTPICTSPAYNNPSNNRLSHSQHQVTKKTIYNRALSIGTIHRWYEAGFTLAHTPATILFMLKIGLTGGIGSGKSTACDYFRELGVPVIDADVIAREITQPGQDALQRIVEVFGTEILTTEGHLDRAYLREKIFTHAELRQQLEAILHPLIKHAISTRLTSINAVYTVIAVPLLIESQWTNLVDRILVIDSPVELQIQRSARRDANSEAQIRSIIQSQTDRQTRCQQADDIILNDGDLTELRQKVEQMHQYYLELGRNTENH